MQADGQNLEQRVVLVTGPSGAGRSTAINALEDMGYEVIDNLPLSLVPRLIEGNNNGRPIALGLDARNRDFNVTALIALIDTLTTDPRVDLSVIYLDCAPDELIRRYGQTRRRHPMAPDGTPQIGIALEVDLLAPIRARADHLIETTGMSPHDLRAEVARWFDGNDVPGLAVSIQSFSYKRGVPRGVDMVFDCRFLRNPHWAPDLRALDGRNPDVLAHIANDPRFDAFIEKISDLILFLLPAQLDEGKAHLAIGFGCTGGQHRSVAVTELIAARLAQAGWLVAKRHRELERRAAAQPALGAG
jgi:UPF0042 nucleotide-binding protein